MIDTLLAEVSRRARGAVDHAGDWIADASIVHLGSKWEGRAALMLFPQGDATPRLVIKIDRTVRGRRRLEREHDALCSVADDTDLEATVPHSLSLFDHDDTLVLVQTALVGRTLAVDLRRRLRPTTRRIREDHDVVLEWLHTLQGPVTAPSQGAIREITADEIVALAEQVLPSDRDWARQTIRHLEMLGARFATLRLPLTRAHGDLGPSNIVLPPGGRRRRQAPRLGVIDWEGAAVQASALNDVLMFLHHYARATLAPRRGLVQRNEVAAVAFLGDGILARETWSRWEAEVARRSVPVEVARYLLFVVLLQFATNATEYAHRDYRSPLWTDVTRHYACQWARLGFPAGGAVS